MRVCAYSETRQPVPVGEDWYVDMAGLASLVPTVNTKWISNEWLNNVFGHFLYEIYIWYILFRLCGGEAVSQLYREYKHAYNGNGQKNSKYLLESARSCRRLTSSAPSEHSNQSPPLDVCTWGNVKETQWKYMQSTQVYHAFTHLHWNTSDTEYQ